MEPYAIQIGERVYEGDSEREYKRLLKRKEKEEKKRNIKEGEETDGRKQCSD